LLSGLAAGRDAGAASAAWGSAARAARTRTAASHDPAARPQHTPVDTARPATACPHTAAAHRSATIHAARSDDAATAQGSTGCQRRGAAASAIQGAITNTCARPATALNGAQSTAGQQAHPPNTEAIYRRHAVLLGKRKWVRPERRANDDTRKALLLFGGSGKPPADP
jgi:hypothetical protein